MSFIFIIIKLFVLLWFSADSFASVQHFGQHVWVTASPDVIKMNPRWEEAPPTISSSKRTNQFHMESLRSGGDSDIPGELCRAGRLCITPLLFVAFICDYFYITSSSWWALLQLRPTQSNSNIWIITSICVTHPALTRVRRDRVGCKWHAERFNQCESRAQKHCLTSCINFAIRALWGHTLVTLRTKLYVLFWFG